MKNKSAIYLLIALALSEITIVLALFVIVFLKDEPLSAQAQAALEYQPPPVLPERNAFVGLVGFNAPSGSDFVRAGDEKIRQANLDFQRYGFNTYAQKQTPQADTPKLAFSVKKYEHSCDKARTETCLDEIRAEAENIHRLQEENRELINRYLKIREMPEFSDYDLSQDAIPPYPEVLSVSKLLSAQAILDIQRGDIAKGLDFIEQDMAFYRKILLAKDITLIDQMVAANQIRRYAILLGLLMEQDALRGETERVRSILTPLEDAKETFLVSGQREHIFVLQGLGRLSIQMSEDARNMKSPKFIEYFGYYLIFQRNMTMNLQSEFGENLKHTLKEMPASRLVDEIPHLYETVRDRVCTIPADYFACKHLKNFVGEILVQIAQSNYGAYLLRIYDMDAHIRLVRAQLEYKLAAKPGDDPAQILARLGPETFNPYTEAPFDWNPEQGTLGFQPGDSKNRETRVEVRLYPYQAPQP
jgi:hypothetical protein